MDRVALLVSRQVGSYLVCEHVILDPRKRTDDLWSRSYFFGCRLTRGMSAWFDAYGVPRLSLTPWSGRRGVYGRDGCGWTVLGEGFAVSRMIESGDLLAVEVLPAVDSGSGMDMLSCGLFPEALVAMVEAGC